MPHTSRKEGGSGFYHVVAKGDGGQIIFESDRDRRRYVKTLEDAVDAHQVKLHAYCLMSTHVHLLVQAEKDELSAFMKQLNETYAMYFRTVTGRIGHVFQRPFWSEPVETDEYFLSALRYIHANPEPARICRAEDYPWSSYGAYMGASSFVETSLALDLLGGVTQFAQFSASDDCLALPFSNSKLAHHLQPDELIQVALMLLGRDVLYSLKSLNTEALKPYVTKLAAAGFNEAEIIRVTGLGRSSVDRANMWKRGVSPFAQNEQKGSIPSCTF